MNIRDLINRIESIELNEGLRLKDIEAQVANEPNEQKRAQTLMTLAQTNKLPGLYDPVSGYFVSADPDMNRGEGGSGEPKPRISATGSEDGDALLAKRGLVPPKANTSTFLRHLNPFSSSNKDYDAGVQGGSQAAIARQNKEDDELKQLANLIPKYKALKDKLASLSGANTDARTGQGIVPADKPLAEALMESFNDLFDGIEKLPGAAGEMLPKIWNKLPSVIRGGEKKAGDEILDRLPNQVSTEIRMPPRPDITDVEWRTVPDTMKGGVGAWLKANPRKSLAAALAAVAAATQIGGGQGQRNGPTADQMATANGVTPTPVPGAVNPNADAKTTDKPAAGSSSTTSIPDTYTVNRGDQLGKIARDVFKTTLPALLAANPELADAKHRGGNLIQPGEIVKKPGSATATPAPAPATPAPADTTADDAKAAEEAKKKEEIKSTQKEIDTMKAQLAALIIDLEKSEDEDNIRQLKDLESQLDDLGDIKSLNSNNPSASNYTNQMDQASDAAAVSDKAPPKFTPKDATYKQEPATDYSLGKGAKLNAMKESDDELARWLKIANIK